MRTIKAYSHLWRVEGVLYNVYDLKLPFAMTYSFVGWTVGGYMLLLFFGNLPPLSLIHNTLAKIALPFLLGWVMSRQKFDGKNPVQFLQTQIQYLFRPKITYMGQGVKRKQKHRVTSDITMVRSVEYANPD